jgi:murein L,D-transpeptidase YafK
MKIFITLVASLVLSACTGGEIPPHMLPLSDEVLQLMAEKDMRQDAPIFIRIFKEESELEVWKAKDDGRYHHLKTYPICAWSGKLGPKQKAGDKQAPEGFYSISKGLMNPYSKYHLAFNLGYPNEFDKAHERTGKHLMVHGDCSSAGCYAMTDAQVEEIYTLAREAFAGGQKNFEVQALPFRMTEENMQTHKKHKWFAFWQNLKEGYDYFEMARKPPKVDVCEKRYLVNAAFRRKGAKPVSTGRCPDYEKIPIDMMPVSFPVELVSAVAPITEYPPHASLRAWQN